MKITIIGAGAMGCLFASFLEKNNEVTLLDTYRPTVENIARYGVDVNEQDGSVTNHKVGIRFSGDAKDIADLIIIFVKDTATEIALKSNMNIIGENTIVLSMQNGMGNDEIIEKFVKKDNILLGTTLHNSVVLKPGSIYHSGIGKSHIGSLSGNADKATVVIEEFNCCGIESDLTENVRYLLWKKLFINATINSITAILGAPIGFLGGDVPSDPCLDLILKEAIEVSNADGFDFTFDEVRNNIHDTVYALFSGKASMVQDMENRRKTEIDFINGSIVRIGKKYGISTPVNEAIVSLVHSKERLIQEFQNEK